MPNWHFDHSKGTTVETPREYCPLPFISMCFAHSLHACRGGLGGGGGGAGGRRSIEFSGIEDMST